MFWGMNLKPNRKYTQTTSKSFHISQAALDCEGLTDDASNKIYISSEDNQKFLICTLRKNICEQAMLDLNFTEGDTICFQSIGSGTVSLSGYLTVDSPFFGDEEEESDFDENMADVANGKDLKTKKGQKKSKAAADSEEDEDDDDDDEEDNDLLKAALESNDSDAESGEEEGEDDDDDEEEDEDDDDDDDAEDDDDDSEEVEEPKPKMAKVDKKESKQQLQNGVAQNAQKTKKEKKAEKQQQKQQQQQKKAQAGGERTLAGGVKIEDIRVGNGPEAKTGKRAQVYYEGRLKSNNKTFDSLKSGAPFKFSLGRGEVIKGWDVGVAGMKVGGKRRITCPPHMAYGARGSAPAIPPNSTLVFEVELKGVN